MRRTIVAALAGGAALLLVACAPTTYDTSITTTVPGAADSTTSSTLPTGSAAELLPRLVEEASGLSRLILDGGQDGAAARRITELWDAVRAEVEAARPDLAPDFAANVARTERAAERNRAADADKAYVALKALADAYLA